jgi:glyoxylase-like metal-dependent hydrolase (beta-lactamase superfamily II)
MVSQIHRIPIGIANVYVVVGSGTVLVDGGQPGKDRLLARALEATSASSRNVKLIVVTHGHWDHMGCLAEMKRLTGAPLAMHRAERERVEKPLKIMPPARTLWGSVFGRLCVAPMMRRARLQSTPVDIVLTDDDYSLEPFGVEGIVLHTPGHSPGSVSILLASGDALVGDLAMNMFPLRLRPGLPIFAEDEPRLRGSIERLLSLGAKTIHPAHGRAFPASMLKAALAELPR